MFRLAPVATMRRTVTIRVPDPDVADKLVEQTLTVLFRIMSPNEVSQFDERVRALPMEERARNPHGFLKQIVIGWEDVADAGGKPVPFTPEALEAALQLPWFPAPVAEEYWRAMAGQPRLGN